MQKLQIAQGKLVQQHAMRLVYPRNGRDMRNHVVLRHLQIIKGCTGSRNAVIHTLNAKPFQGTHLKMLHQAVGCGIAVKKPLFHRINVKLVTKQFMETRLLPLGINHLLRLETVQQLVNGGSRPFRGQKLAGRKI